jgi:ribulose-5-phosphate 4-epimerase/fuculose-1-phosphate aldolase
MHWLLRAGVRSSPPPSMPPPRAARRLLRTARHLQTAAAPSWQPPEQHETPAAEELELRDELACAYRWADRHGLSEGVCNHFTAEVSPGRFLVIPYGMSWAEVTAASLLLVDERGTVLRGGGAELPAAVATMTGAAPPTPDGFDETGLLEPTAFYIHGSIHKLLGSRARVVLHTHMPYATALACTTARAGGGAQPAPNRLAFVHQSSSRFWSRTVYEDRFGGLVMDDEEGMAFARLLAELPEKENLSEELSVLFLANHGVLVCAPTVAMAYDSLYYLERTCMFQVKAMQAMGPHGQLQRISDPQMDALHAQKMKVCSFQAQKHFGALRRRLTKEEPETFDNQSQWPLTLPSD